MRLKFYVIILSNTLLNFGFIMIKALKIKDGTIHISLDIKKINKLLCYY
jgi:hypothetical protein